MHDPLIRNIIHHFWLGVILIASLIVIMQVQAGDTDANKQESESSAAGTGWHHGLPFAYEEGLLDYVKFPCAWLADHGVNVYASLLPIYQNITKGGLDYEDYDKWTTSYDVQTYLDSSKIGLWKGGYGLVQYLIDPGIVEGNDDTLALGLRTLIHF